MPQNGEIVEILTSASSKGPSRDWLKIVKTGEARNKIRQWFKKEQRPENIAMGKAEIDREFKRLGQCSESQRNEILVNVAARIGIQSVDDLYNVIGYGGFAVSKLTSRLKDEFDRVVKPEIVQNESQDINNKLADASRYVQSLSKKRLSSVIIDGVDGCAVKLAKCCNPIPGDRIIGFITKGYGVSVHKFDCINVKSGLEKDELKDRWVSATWDVLETGNTMRTMFESSLAVSAYNRITIISDIMLVLADMKVTVLQINTRMFGNDEIVINLLINAKNLEHVNSIVSRLRTVKSVNKVIRGTM